jgi:elongation factor G
MEMRQDISEVKAEIPLAETFGYSTVLRSLTQGRVHLNLSFLCYQEAPSTIADKILSKLRCA